ncbi:hypothetical protein AgCh_015723 [Apium graveolens]
MKGSLFIANLDSTTEDGICCFYTKASIEQSNLWHKKLSHLNIKAINTLVKKKLVRDMPKLKFAQIEVCEACQKGKMKRSSHRIFIGKTAYKVYVIDQKKIMESTDVTFHDDKCPGLECLDDNEAEAFKFENHNINSGSDEEDEVNAQ